MAVPRPASLARRRATDGPASKPLNQFSRRASGRGRRHRGLVDRHAGTHRRRHRDLAQEHALRRRRLGLLQVATAMRGGFPAAPSRSKLALPIVQWITPALSVRKRTWPALALRTAPATSGVTVPTLGFGIRPRGPRIWPSWPTTRIASGLATTTSKLSSPAFTFSARSSMPTMSAPASRASVGILAGSEHGNADGLARAVRKHGRAADLLVRLGRVHAEVHGHVDGLVELGAGELLDEPQGHRRSDTACPGRSSRPTASYAWRWQP